MKTAKELFEQLNSVDENDRIEAKKASEIGKSIMETVCAFSNEPGLGGGYILLGAVRAGGGSEGLPNYIPENIQDTDKTQIDIASRCASMFNVSIRPQISCEKIDGKNVIVVKIEEVPESLKPVYFKNRGLPKGAFRRVGSSDQECSEDDMRIFYASADGFESTIVRGTTLADIDDNAVAYYRKLRAEVNPNAEELAYNDSDMLLALRACEEDGKNGYVLTYTGLIVFGKSMSLRRHLPALRVDYIRVPGNKWVENPDQRFISTNDMRGALILLVNRVQNAVMDDLPKGFELPQGEMQAKTPVVLPLKVLREAIVNAFIHCSYKVNQPIQIIRYSNRIEFINPGYSLKSPEKLGEPGSVQRNPYISTIFHDTNLAETKGSGIRSMRKHMEEANMIPPTFDSDRAANQFTARLLLYHLLDEKSIEWLKLFAGQPLNDEQKLALVFVREVGAIDNITYRQLNGNSNNQKASADLHAMCSLGFLEQKGQNRNTYYIAGQKLQEIMALNGNAEALNGNAEALNGNAEALNGNAEALNGNADILVISSLPQELRKRIEKLGKRAKPDEMKSVILDLCSWKSLSLNEIAQILNRDVKTIRNLYLKPLMNTQQLFYTIPAMIRHPEQKYTSKK